jgi:hypothetical protein
MAVSKAKIYERQFAACSNLADTIGPVKVREPQRFWHPQDFVHIGTMAAIIDNESKGSRLNRLSAMPGEHLDLTDHPPGGDNAGRGAPARARRFVGVQFTCCDVYSRVYINRDETAYEGNCPKCAKRVRLLIGPGGTDARFFTAG